MTKFRIWTLLLVMSTVMSGMTQLAADGVVRAEAEPTRPNILLIVTDDQRWDTMEFMPLTKARIFDEGVTFSNAFATTPLCCPSRASIYTGLYSGRHGVRVNSDSLSEDQPTFIKDLDAAGYYTGLVGAKYLNSWNPRNQRPEFDFWAVGNYANDLTKQMMLNVNGQNINYAGRYRTHVYGDYAGQFIDTAHTQSDPFMLILAANAPHLPAIPAPGDENLYPDLPAHRPPNFNEADVSDKPAWVQNTPQLTSTEVTELDRRRLGQLQMLHSLDLEINGLLDQLEAAGTLEDTVVMFLSDNGYLWGEHRMQEKWRPYDESVRIPFAIRYPSAYPQPRVEDRIVGNIDVAPTVWEVAGLPIPSEVDGQSLLPLLADDPGMDWRDDILLEGAEFSYNAVHTGDAVYIEYTADLPELYDLTLDPYQLDNQVNNPAYDGLESEMISRLDRLKPPDVRHQPELVSDQSYRIMRGAWRHVDDDNASAEGMRAASSTGQFIRLQTPAVRQLTVVFFKSWNQGIARIVIDGQVHGLVDLYSPIQKYGYRHHITGLTFAPHTISVEVTGQRNPASREAIVTVDAFVVAGTFVEETDPRLVYTTWWPWKHPEAAGGLYYRSRAANATVRFDPVGTNATLLTARGPEFGIAEIYLRGELIETVDLYSPVYEWQFPVPITGFRPGVTEHVVVKVTGRKNPASSDTLVIVDGFTQP